uniref:Uncharacterized protein n=1 Tax=Chromera velia CCMP2878 TaxID=1169474 RepID=A0A0G4FHM4_9ALVE|eukprot:Cvel_17041.t1-p1 / transcript=Cvel_17041.t1 / gene=Cvel_17041 / organism=Chromera_velia_CCMP2878 / gene_product=hypothetical protein / transcript_product=hypothetical protein / location=Cvel_scaffold1341:12250-16253(-) / protein_length=254 / sequence_SO=supercontig / SO=protein_coding / is_pseudo=false
MKQTADGLDRVLRQRAPERKRIGFASFASDSDYSYEVSYIRPRFRVGVLSCEGSTRDSFLAQAGPGAALCEWRKLIEKAQMPLGGGESTADSSSGRRLEEREDQRPKEAFDQQRIKEGLKSKRVKKASEQRKGVVEGASQGEVAASGVVAGALDGEVAASGVVEGASQGEVAASGVVAGALDGEVAASGVVEGASQGEVAASGVVAGALDGEVAASGVVEGALEAGEGADEFEGALSRRESMQGFKFQEEHKRA